MPPAPCITGSSRQAPINLPCPPGFASCWNTQPVVAFSCWDSTCFCEVQMPNVKGSCKPTPGPFPKGRQPSFASLVQAGRRLSTSHVLLGLTPASTCSLLSHIHVIINGFNQNPCVKCRWQIPEDSFTPPPTPPPFPQPASRRVSTSKVLLGRRILRARTCIWLSCMCISATP